jgi:hypothetical protein
VSETQAVQRLLERLISDPVLRERFARDPVGTAQGAGLHELASELARNGSGPMRPLEARESRSSLAGALAAAAAEGLGLFDHVGQLFGADDAYAATGSGAGSGGDPDQFGVQGTGGPMTPETQALLQNDHVTFDTSGIADLQAGKIDPRAVSVLTELSKDHQLVISSTTSDHPQNTAGGSVSNHFYGRAFDIASVDGQPVTPSNDAAKALALELAKLDPSIRPSEIGSPWQLSGPAYFTDGDHQNHVHVGFDDPIAADWQPPAADVPVPAAAAPAAAPAVAAVPAPAQAISQDAAPEDDTAGDDLRADGTVDTSGDDDAEDDSDDQDAAAAASGSNADGDGESEDDSDEEDANDGVGDEASDDPSDDTDDENEPDESDSGDGGSDGDSDAPGEGSNGEDANDDSGDDSPPNPSNPSTPSTPETPESPDTPADAPPDNAAAPTALPDVPVDAGTYPGDNAPPEQIAAWLAAGAQARGLPPELPVMAALVESGMKNLDHGDADSVGLFQMRASVWDSGSYAGYRGDAGLQLKWFLDQAEAVKAQRVAAGKPVDDPAQYGDWIADIERPAEQFRGRYQLRLEDAQQFVAGLAAQPTAPAAGANDAQVLQVPVDSSP